MVSSSDNSHTPLSAGCQLHQGKYRIIAVLGHGGFGLAYLAEHSILQKKVAIKEFFPKIYCNRNADSTTITLGTSANHDIVDRFKSKFIKEAQKIATLSHPGIVKILDIFEENNTAYYVMDYIDGKSLADIVNTEGKVAIDKALGWIKQVGNALSYIHSHRLTHLDVKPANIMIDQKGDAILIDFGQAKQYDNDGGETSTTPIGISHGYAPPEQYRNGGVSQFSPQSDIYALGATLYKLITGVTPPDAMALIDESLTFPSDTPPHICEAITRSMSIHKKDRQKSVATFMTQISDSTHSSDNTIFDSSNIQTYHQKSKTSSNSLIGCLIIVIVAFILVIIVWKNNLHRQPDPAISESATPMAEYQTSNDGIIAENTENQTEEVAAESSGIQSYAKPIDNEIKAISSEYGTPRHLSLALRDSNGIRYYVTESEWYNFPNKSNFTKDGICIIKNGERFILGWDDQAYGLNYYEALSKYGNYLPNKKQADIIQNCTNLREKATAFGGDNYGNWYWTRTECPSPDNDAAYIFCPGIPEAAYDRADKNMNSPLLVVLVYPI